MQLFKDTPNDVKSINQLQKSKLVSFQNIDKVSLSCFIFGINNFRIKVIPVKGMDLQTDHFSKLNLFDQIQRFRIRNRNDTQCNSAQLSQSHSTTSYFLLYARKESSSVSLQSWLACVITAFCIQAQSRAKSLSSHQFWQAGILFCSTLADAASLQQASQS